MENEKNLEELFSEIEELIQVLENPNTNLTDSFSAYKKGIELVKVCNDSIDKVEKEVKILSGNEGEDE